MLDEYVTHCNQHRPHRSLGQHAPTATHNTETHANRPDPEVTRLRRDPILGGLINEYRHAA